MRRLSVPPAPEVEIREIVGGEISHYQILRTDGAFGYAKLEAANTEASDGMTPVVVVACEEPIITGIKSLADHCHMEEPSFEPLHFAMCRIAVASGADDAPVFAVMMADSHTDLAVVYQGKLWFYRRLDIGSDNVRAGAIIAAEEMGESAHHSLAAHHLAMGPALDVATEIHRSIEYIEREFIGLPRVENLTVVVNETDLGVLSEFLSSQMGFRCRTLYPDAVEVEPALSPLFSGNDGLRFVSALGLALRDAGSAIAGAPEVDLLSALRASMSMHEKKRNIAGSLVTSVVALVLAGVGFQLYNGQIASVQQETKESIARAEKINNEAMLQREQRALKAQQYTLLRREGVPVTALLDYLQAGIQPGVGLSGVAVDPNLGVAISGDSMSEAALIKTVEQLQRVPVLQGVSIVSFNRDQRGKSDGILFTLASRTVSLDSVEMIGEATRSKPKAAATGATPAAMTTEVAKP
jgi:hypothetical protein